ncbi:MAG: N-acetyl-alpha-D-glucosaminyl L-malate synthase BshA [Deltaproteobacteria bacterium]|nr:N-acetyl-alpha-D-glucosaminyl L-malate synthase BshA [Deltaproteobacteria bacterium]
MEPQRLRIGISCYATYGGSGVIAAEIGMAMARRGHSVHFIGNDVPRRLDRFQENIFFHEVEIRDYPVFVAPPYALSLASKIVEVSTYESLDLIHVHYAVPHATSAYLARQVLGPKAPKIITTLHGTDITLVGNDRGYLPITRFSIMESDGITTPSVYLKQATHDKLNIPSSVPIEVVSNFVDTELFSPADSPCPEGFERRLHVDCLEQTKCIVHVSNFRPVKRMTDVVKIFSLVQREIPSRLLLIGDGPERSRIESEVRDAGLSQHVVFLGKLEEFDDILRQSDVFLLPSESESFGLAALEAMSCGVPVVCSKAGGLPEVVLHGKTGFLADVGDVESMAGFVRQLLTDKALYDSCSVESRKRAVEQFNEKLMIDRYEDYYRRVLAQPVRSHDSSAMPPS